MMHDDPLDMRRSTLEDLCPFRPRVVEQLRLVTMTLPFHCHFFLITSPPIVLPAAVILPCFAGKKTSHPHT
jgi:hypothetical protein